MQKLEVGQKFPGWKYSFEGALLSVISSGLQLLISLPGLTEQDVQDFKTLAGYGIYKSNNFPYGLILWEFANEWVIETPFDVDEERTIRDNEVQSFLGEDKNALHRTLIDGQGIIRSLNLAGLQLGFVQALKQIWQDKNIDWSQYDKLLNSLLQQPTEAIWRKTTSKWKHKDDKA